MYPLISVIVPVYNVEAFLPRCMQSILEQTYPHLEIILVDDGSQDGSGALCDDYAARHSHVTVHHKTNAGLGMARNSGLDIARGEYILFVDSDDFLREDAVQTLYNRIQADNSDLVIGNFVKTYEDGTCSQPCYRFEDGVFTFEEFLRRVAVFGAIPASACGRLYRREVLSDLRFPPVSIGEDTLTFPRVLERCDRISLEDQPLYYYFMRRNSLMRETDDHAMLGHLHASLTMARFLWDHDQQSGAANWFAIAIRNALTIRRRRRCFAEIDTHFPRAARKAVWRQMDRKGKIAWLCLHVPCSDYVFRRRLKNDSKKA